MKRAACIVLQRIALTLCIVAIGLFSAAPTLDRDKAKVDSGKGTNGGSSGKSGKSKGKNGSSKGGSNGGHGHPHRHSSSSVGVGVSVDIGALLSGRKKPPFGQPVIGRPGFVLSPFAPDKVPIDVRKFPPGTAVRDPHTGETFLVPPVRTTGSNL
jgi:hypothetical protein